MNKPRSTRPVAHATSDQQDDALVRKLLRLALDLRELDVYDELPEPLKKQRSELRKLIRKCLQQGKDALLEEALEATQDEDAGTYAMLKASVEELSEVVVFRRDEGADLEVNAFVIPLFVRTRGGLRIEQCFTDEQAFDALRDSLQEWGLESRQAKVVLVSHAYHRDELARIRYSALNAMVHEASEAMTRKRASGADMIARSISGWPPSGFSSDDQALELRFLLGFALKRLDDPFYAIPEKEAAADRYFENRAQRFRQWATAVAPLLQRCLVNDGRAVELDFLYQDLFHGGVAAGSAEYDLLRLLTELQHGLQQSDVAAANCVAVAGPGEDDGLRVNLYSVSARQLVASAERPGYCGDLQAEASELYDALQTLGVPALELARDFDADGQPLGLRPWKPRAL